MKFRPEEPNYCRGGAVGETGKHGKLVVLLAILRTCLKL